MVITYSPSTESCFQHGWCGGTMHEVFWTNATLQTKRNWSTKVIEHACNCNLDRRCVCKHTNGQNLNRLQNAASTIVLVKVIRAGLRTKTMYVFWVYIVVLQPKRTLPRYHFESLSDHSKIRIRFRSSKIRNQKAS
jgi:hypothetical protein